MDGHLGSARQRKPGCLCGAGLALVRVRAGGARCDPAGPGWDSTAHAAAYVHADLDGDPHCHHAVGRHPNADGHLDRYTHAQRHVYPRAKADRHPYAHGDADPETNRDAIAHPVNGYCSSVAHPDADRHTPSDGERHANADPDTWCIPFCHGHRPRHAHADGNGDCSPTTVGGEAFLNPASVRANAFGFRSR